MSPAPSLWALGFHVVSKPLLRGTQRDVTMNHLTEVQASATGTDVLKADAP